MAAVDRTSCDLESEEKLFRVSGSEKGKGWPYFSLFADGGFLELLQSLLL